MIGFRLRQFIKSLTGVFHQVAVRQLQQELADTLKKQSMSEASLEVITRHRINLEDEIQNLKKKLDRISSQVCMHAAMVMCSL